MSMSKLLEQAREMKAKTDRELAETQVQGRVGGGLVVAQMNGHRVLLSLTIEPEAVDPESPQLLEDMVLAAYNEAARKMESILHARFGPVSKFPSFF